MPYSTTTAIAGYGGVVTAAGGTGSVGTEIRKWNADLTCDLLDATNEESAGNEESLAGLKGGSGSLEAVGTCPLVGAVTTLTLKTKSTGGRTIAGAAIIGEVGPGVPVDGVVVHVANFTFTGVITVS